MSLIRSLLLFTVLATVPAGVAAQAAGDTAASPLRQGPPHAGARSDSLRTVARAAIDELAPELAALARRTVGLSVAVGIADSMVAVRTFGLADVDGRPVTPDTRFRIYSLSKPMTALAAGQLMERGRLDPNAPVQRYVPSFPQKSGVITPLELINHTSGIRHYRDQAEAESTRHCGSVSEALEIFQDDPLVHAPGEEETYSTWGFVLLSRVIEGAGGESYAGYMARHVFEPAGMASTVLDDPTRPDNARASFYTLADDGPHPAKPVDNTCKWGGGAWLSTATDVVRFGLAALDGRLLSHGMVARLLSGRERYIAGGIGVGGVAYLGVDQRTGVIIVLLSNANGPDLPAAMRDVLVRYLDAAGDRSQEP